MGGSSWLVFAALVGWAVAESGPPESTQLLVGPVAFCAFYLVHVAWVAHNRRIYRRKGPRRSVPAGTAAPWTRDRQGLPVSGDLASPWHGHEVVLSTTNAGKRYAVPVRP